MDRAIIRQEIMRRLEYHPGDAPWSCIECYHNRPCVDREILKAALRELDSASSVEAEASEAARTRWQATGW